MIPVIVKKKINKYPHLTKQTEKTGWVLYYFILNSGVNWDNKKAAPSKENETQIHMATIDTTSDKKRAFLNYPSTSVKYNHYQLTLSFFITWRQKLKKDKRQKQMIQ